MFITAAEENISFNKMIKCALQDIYLHNPNIKWNDIIGLDAAKQLVKEAVVYPTRVRMGSLLGVISVYYPLYKLYVIHSSGREAQDDFLSTSKLFACVTIFRQYWSTKAQYILGSLKSCYMWVQGRCLL